MINFYLLYLCVISGIFAICFTVVAFSYFTEVFGKVNLFTQNSEKEDEEDGPCCIDSNVNDNDIICR